MPKKTTTLPDKKILLLDRGRVPWQDWQGTWQNKDASDDVHVPADAPPGFHVTAVLQPDDPYLWFGIAAPDTQEARVCFAVVKGDTLYDLAREILKYAGVR